MTDSSQPSGGHTVEFFNPLSRPTEPGAHRRSVIDVGTNSVKLLVADVQGAAVEPVLEQSEQTRLGRGFYEHHRLQSAAIEATARAVARFARQAREAGAEEVRVIATSAARDAVNPGDLIRAIEAEAGLTAQIISGEQEAEWVFRGVASDPLLGQQRLLLLDVGGGSTEFILGERGHHTFRQSFPLGSVRLLEKLRPADPPEPGDLPRCRAWLHGFFAHRVAPSLEAYRAGPSADRAILVGTGGTATILARMEAGLTHFDRLVLDQTRLKADRVTHFVRLLWGISVAERRSIAGLPANRADIIPMGAAIFEAVMTHFRFEELVISTRGLRFGAVLAG
ncbi:MAG TPA: Ppx/GppA family phosphatase [Methylomirabilota bacterium]|nr:Ppx/GppA family phosphatase [Methylomirabilota bacterium]